MCGLPRGYDDIIVLEVGRASRRVIASTQLPTACLWLEVTCFQIWSSSTVKYLTVPIRIGLPICKPMPTADRYWLNELADPY